MEYSANGQKSVIAHLRTPYLPVSETFIYNSLIATDRLRSIVLTMREENPENFPFPDVHLMAVPWPIRVLWERVLQFDSSVLKYAPWYPAHMKAIRHHKVKLLHAHFGTTGYFAWPLKKFHNIPLVTSFYGADVSRLGLLPSWRRRYKRLFASGEHFTVVAKLMKQQLIELGCPEERITLIWTGIDVDTFAYQPRQLPQMGDPTKFLLVARFVEKKGVEYAIRAFAQIHAKHPDTELRIIGDGPLRPQLEQLIAELGVHDSIKLLGFQPTPVFVDETKRCHIVLQPSVTARDGDQEGGATVAIMEAQAAGMPFVATAHAAIPEQVLDREAGFLVPERDVSALAERMMFMVENPSLWNEMGYKARQHVEQNFSEQSQTKKLIEVYEQVLEDYKTRQALVVPIERPVGNKLSGE